MTSIFKKTTASLTALALALPSLAAIPTSTYTYNTAGQLQRVDEGNGQRHDYSYNAWGSPGHYYPPDPSATGVTQGEIAFDYGRTTQVERVRDQRLHDTSYALDGFGRVIGVTSPDAGSASRTYDAAGNLKSTTTSLGVTFQFDYDALNRLTAANYGDASTTLSYYATGLGAGLPSGMTDSSGSTTWGYDALNRVTSRTQTTTGPNGGAGAVLGVQSVWSGGRLTQLTYPSGKVVTYSYDAEQVSSIAVNGVTVISNVAYQPFGPPLSWTMGGAGTYSRTLDTAGRVASYTYENGTRTLSWDASSRLTSIANPNSSTWTYGYDNLNRATSANETTLGARAFALDAVGNRTSTTINGTAYSYGVDAASNRLTTSTAPGTAQSYTTDGAGRITSDGTRLFTWTNAGQMAMATGPQGSAAYVYNGAGQRVKKVTGTGVTASARHYLYADDGVSLLGEYVQASPSASPAALNEIVYLEGTPVLVMRASSVYYIQTDHLTTPRTIKDSVGTVVWRWESDAFGNGAANQNPGGVFLFEFNGRFPGQLFDAETGLHYNNARYYDPVIGRYISSDPIGLGGGPNTFAYAGGAPLAHYDTRGLFVEIVADSLQASHLIGDAYLELKSTPRGRQICETLEQSTATFRIYPTSLNAFYCPAGATDAQCRGKSQAIFVDPFNDAHLITSEGMTPTPLSVVLGHELGHALGIGDTGPGNMANVIANENPVRKALRVPLRTQYGQDEFRWTPSRRSLEPIESSPVRP